MNTFLETWLSDLRSGEFAQGHARLTTVKNGNRFHCCLGVAAERSGLPKKVEELPLGEGQRIFYGGESYYAPEEVRAALGFTTSRGEFHQTPDNATKLKAAGIDPDSLGGEWSLATLNDAAMATFAQIADFVASEPEGLFEVFV
jgi:hypothetical protein